MGWRGQRIGLIHALTACHARLRHPPILIFMEIILFNLPLPQFAQPPIFGAVFAGIVNFISGIKNSVFCSKHTYGSRSFVKHLFLIIIITVFPCSHAFAESDWPPTKKLILSSAGFSKSIFIFNPTNSIQGGFAINDPINFNLPHDLVKFWESIIFSAGSEYKNKKFTTIYRGRLTQCWGIIPKSHIGSMSDNFSGGFTEILDGYFNIGDFANLKANDMGAFKKQIRMKL